MSETAGQVAITKNQAADWLESHTSMTRKARTALSEVAADLLLRVPGAPANLAIAGPPGSGKSTLARLLTALLNQSGRTTVMLSLDDYYLGRQEREALALSDHELLLQRGVPGTHDWQRLLADFDRLRDGDIADLKLSVFDKSTDDLKPESEWRRITEKPECLIVEGWCIGAPAQSSQQILQAFNRLEEEQDSSGQWRQLVNNQLTRYRNDLSHRINQFWYLAVPDWECVVDWRWQQEQELTQRRLGSREDVVRFLATFERIVAHMQSSAPQWADVLLCSDHSHRLKISRT